MLQPSHYEQGWQENRREASHSPSNKANSTSQPIINTINRSNQGVPMSNENDDATQLGSIGRHMSKPQQPGNPQARPAFQATSLPTHPQEQDGDEEGTVLSTHNATPSRPTRPTVPMAQPMQAQPTQSAPTQQPLPQSQSAPVMATRQFPQTTAPSVKPAQPAMALP